MIETPGTAEVTAEADVAPLAEVKEKDPVQKIVSEVAQLESDVCKQAIRQSREDGGWQREVFNKEPNADGTVQRYCRTSVEAGGQCGVVVSDDDPSTGISRPVAVVGFTNAKIAEAAIKNRSKFPWKAMASWLGADQSLSTSWE